MPVIIGGPIKISSVSGGATVNFGDTGIIAPKTASKQFNGAGGTTGDFSQVFTGVSNTNTNNPTGTDTNTQSGT